MSERISPFAMLTGAEKQIKWLEYQSVRLPYTPVNADTEPSRQESDVSPTEQVSERPQPPPEVFVNPRDFQRTRHGQYDAVIARLKQAELQARGYPSMSQLPQQ